MKAKIAFFSLFPQALQRGGFYQDLVLFPEPSDFDLCLPQTLAFIDVETANVLIVFLDPGSKAFGCDPDSLRDLDHAAVSGFVETDGLSFELLGVPCHRLAFLG